MMISFPRGHAICDNVIPLMGKGRCAYIFLSFKAFSALIFNTVNMGRYKQKVFGVLTNFKGETRL